MELPFSDPKLGLNIMQTQPLHLCATVCVALE